MASLEGDLIRERFSMTGLPSVLSRVYLSRSLAELGAFAEGTARGEEGIRIAEMTDHPFSLIWACAGIGKLYLNTGDVHRGVLVLERGLGLCQIWDIPALFPTVASTWGTAYALLGRVTEALPLLEQAASQGGRSGLWCTRLSEAYLFAGRTKDALECMPCACSVRSPRTTSPPRSSRPRPTTRQALALADELGMRPLQAYCHRGLGTLYAATGQCEPARAALSAAISLYRAMDMTFWLPQTEATLAQVV